MSYSERDPSKVESSCSAINRAAGFGVALPAQHGSCNATYPHIATSLTRRSNPDSQPRMENIIARICLADSLKEKCYTALPILAPARRLQITVTLAFGLSELSVFEGGLVRLRTSRHVLVPPVGGPLLRPRVFGLGGSQQLSHLRHALRSLVRILFQT